MPFPTDFHTTRRYSLPRLHYLRVRFVHVTLRVTTHVWFSHTRCHTPRCVDRCVDNSALLHSHNLFCCLLLLIAVGTWAFFGCRLHVYVFHLFVTLRSDVALLPTTALYRFPVTHHTVPHPALFLRLCSCCYGRNLPFTRYVWMPTHIPTMPHVLVVYGYGYYRFNYDSPTLLLMNRPTPYHITDLLYAVTDCYLRGTLFDYRLIPIV